MNSPVKLWRNQKRMRELLHQEGEIVTWTVIRVPPEGFSNQAPYITAVIKLENGKQLVAQVVDIAFSDVKMGLKVKTVLRRVTEVENDGIIPYGIKVRPV